MSHCKKREIGLYKALYIAAVLVLLVLFCMLHAESVSAAVKVHLNKTKVTIHAGSKVTLKVRGYKKKVKWSVKGKKLVTMRTKGSKKLSVVLTAKEKAGSCYVVAKAGKTVLRCKITVKKREKEGAGDSGVTAHFEDEKENSSVSGNDRNSDSTSSNQNVPASNSEIAVSDADDKISIVLTAVPDSDVGGPVTVSKSGGGEYTSLTRALYETAGDVVVKAGEYDIVEEYRDYFGRGIFDTMNDRTGGMNLFQFGLIVNNRIVRFEKGAVVKCDLTKTKYGTYHDSIHRFSPFNLGSNAVLDGLTCHAVGTWYLIHDDFGDESVHYTNYIRNCTLTMASAKNRNVIGGGTRPHSKSVISNCYMDNGLGKQSETLRYHNCDYVGAAPVVIIENCRVNGFIGARYYGAQNTTKMTFTVINCTTGSGVKKLAESSKYAVDNVVLELRGNVIQ